MFCGLPRKIVSPGVCGLLNILDGISASPCYCSFPYLRTNARYAACHLAYGVRQLWTITIPPIPLHAFRALVACYAYLLFIWRGRRRLARHPHTRWPLLSPPRYHLFRLPRTASSYSLTSSISGRYRRAATYYARVCIYRAYALSYTTTWKKFCRHTTALRYAAHRNLTRHCLRLTRCIARRCMTTRGGSVA